LGREPSSIGSREKGSHMENIYLPNDSPEGSTSKKCPRYGAKGGDIGMLTGRRTSEPEKTPVRKAIEQPNW